MNNINGWFSIKDKLPDKGEKVIGWLVSKYGNECVLAKINREEKWVFQELETDYASTEGYGEIISHWQPLPKSPSA